VIVDEGGSVGFWEFGPHRRDHRGFHTDLTVLETRPAATRVDLGKARRVVAVGRGLARREDLALIGSWRSLDAEVGLLAPGG